MKSKKAKKGKTMAFAEVMYVYEYDYDPDIGPVYAVTEAPGELDDDALVGIYGLQSMARVRRDMTLEEVK